MEAEEVRIPRVKNLGRVFFALSLLHFSLTGIIGSLAFHAGAELRMQEVRKAIQPAKNEGLSLDPSNELRLSFVIASIIVELDEVLTLPLRPWYKSVPNPSYALSTFKMPWFVALLNSLINGALLFILLFILSRILLRREHPLREWLEGRGLRHSYSLVESISFSSNKPKILQVAGKLKALEGFRYGPILIIAFFHVALQQIHGFMVVARRMGGRSDSFYHEILHFPTTPCIVDASFWDANHVEPWAKLIVGCATALFWGIFLMAAYQFIRSIVKPK